MAWRLMCGVLLLLRLDGVLSFAPWQQQQQQQVTVARVSPDGLTPEQVKASADMFKNINADQLDMMLEQIENMGPFEQEQYKKMGVDIGMMKTSMRMLKNNPTMLDMYRKSLQSMSPEQLMQASKVAQEKLQGMSSTQFDSMAEQLEQQVSSFPTRPAPAAAPAAAPTAAPAAASAVAVTARDPKLIDAMFATAEYSANPPSGGVDLPTLKKLPPIAALRGDRADDLSDDELAEVWSAEAGGGPRVDRAGFERVWLAIDDLYEEDLMVEARRPPKKSRAADE
ncbi:hypothetical protein CTAYLR_009100 [Chrysophaeum taylorii]|uniref:Uncharacterized protein n=1 Tax=Chrysophaeum taylorii TaxID=2483200 RepID=A0AAD7XP98_9STRA|nr:hypothetical protein CTAYLR_009100 [Chrysophaeum taylorii]